MLVMGLTLSTTHATLPNSERRRHDPAYGQIYTQTCMPPALTQRIRQSIRLENHRAVRLTGDINAARRSRCFTAGAASYDACVLDRRG